MSESSIVNEVISEISVFFKTHKITNFPPIRRFYAQKTIVFVVFCSLVFVLLVGFCLICVFMGSKSFVIKNINSLKTVLITSFTMLLTCALSSHLWRICLYALMFICDHPWESLLFIRIFLNLFLFMITCVNLFS